MRNIINEKPSLELTGRLLASVNYVDNIDIFNKNVLNIGCGYGWCELNFLTRGVKEMVGCEISESDLKTARENVKNDKVKFIIASALELPFPDNHFDTVVSWEVIEHIPKNSESKMFSEIKRVLKPGGKLYLSTPHTSFLSNFFDPAWWLIGHRHYSEKELKRYANDIGMTTTDVKIKGRFWVILESLNMYFSKWVLRRGILLKQFFVKKTNNEYRNTGYVNIFITIKNE